MSSPYKPPGQQPDGPADQKAAVHDAGSLPAGSSDETTQIPSTPLGGYDASPPSLRKQSDADSAGSGYGSSASPGWTGSSERSDPPPASAVASETLPYKPPQSPGYSEQQDRWSQSYDEPAHQPGTAVTSVYPQSAPGYAPEGYPQAYAPAVVVPPPSSPPVPEKPASRVGPAFLSAVLGLLLVAGGMYLLAHFGAVAGRNLSGGKVSIKDSLLAVLGVVLLLVATIGNGWSPWSTLLPGLALTGLGGWALFDTGAAARIGHWVHALLNQNEVSFISITGFLLAVGAVLLGSSIAVTLARAGGKRDGRILGRR